MRGLLPAPSLFLFLLVLGGCAEADTQIDASINGEVSPSQIAKQDITTNWLLGEPDLLLPVQLRILP